MKKAEFIAKCESVFQLCKEAKAIRCTCYENPDGTCRRCRKGEAADVLWGSLAAIIDEQEVE